LSGKCDTFRVVITLDTFIFKFWFARLQIQVDEAGYQNYESGLGFLVLLFLSATWSRKQILLYSIVVDPDPV
jgi:hypothetical protein